MRQGFTTAKLLGVPRIIPTRLLVNKFASHCTERLGSKIPARLITYMCLQPEHLYYYTAPPKEYQGGIVLEKAKINKQILGYEGK